MRKWCGKTENIQQKCQKKNRRYFFDQFFKHTKEKKTVTISSKPKNSETEREKGKY